MTKYFAEESLLKPPEERAAFSDRQAYLCAELSKIAYFRFEGGHTVDAIIAVAKTIIGEGEKFGLLEMQLRQMLGGSAADEYKSLDAFKKILNSVGFEQVHTFSEKGTQAFFCTRKRIQVDGSSKTVAYLVFRGTEPKEFEDIKADINARLEPVLVGDSTIALHSGYHKALNQVIEPLNEALHKIKFDQLIVSGHSLGGALAIVYTRLHASSVNGACYTFGAPPVGAVEVQYDLKTPVYEVINGLDIVPSLPNPWLGTGGVLVLRLLRLAAKLFTLSNRILASGSWDEKLEAYVEMMTRYRHPGYQSYLIGVGSDARLRYNLGLYDRVFSLWFPLLKKRTFSSFSTLVSDHLIDAYIEKLKQHALSRNK